MLINYSAVNCDRPLNLLKSNKGRMGNKCDLYRRQCSFSREYLKATQRSKTVLEEELIHFPLMYFIYSTDTRIVSCSKKQSFPIVENIATPLTHPDLFCLYC